MELLVAIIALAAAVYLAKSFRQWLHERNIKRAVTRALDTDSLPESGWAKTLAKARHEMPPEQYEKFERAIYSLIEKINRINTSGLSERERKEAFARLSSQDPLLKSQDPKP